MNGRTTMAEGKWIHDLKATTPPADAARHVLTVRLEVVRDHVPGALHEADKDPEHVHQLRVSTRRSGAAVGISACCLPDKAYKAARKKLRRLRRAAGEARDWDVFFLALTTGQRRAGEKQRAGLDYLAGYARGRRAAAGAHLAEVCPDHPFAFDKLLAATVAAVHRPHGPHHPATLLDLARPMLCGLVNELDEAAAKDLNDYEHLHQVRIIGKRLRYAMEVFAECFAPPFREE